MKIVVFILLGLLVAWWCILASCVISWHRDRARAAAKPMTREQSHAFRKLEASMRRYRLHLRDHLATAPFVIPFIVFLLPMYLWVWLGKSRYPKPSRSGAETPLDAQPRPTA